VDTTVIAELKKLSALAPLHMPAAIAGIEAIAAWHPRLFQVACFDTAFHASMPEIARRLPLPLWADRAGVRRYGFHGISYEYVLSKLGPEAPSRIVIAHLGNGSSLVAVKDGRSIDTTMGFTPAGGVLMGTRTGDLDPGALVYLLREKHLSTDEIERLVERESGLLGVGGTSDMIALLERADERARLAVAMFGYAVRKAIGALGAALGGIDLLVFTGGIGEHAPSVRADACAGLESFGVHLDEGRNSRGEEIVSVDESPCAVRVIATNEDLVIAQHALRLHDQRRAMTAET
jgi:acetate kinase